MDYRLCINPKTNKTLLIEGRFPLPTVLEPMISPLWLPPKPTWPPGLSSRLWNICLLPFMCREQPESRYHDWCFCFATKDICHMYYFILRYPYFLGSWFVSFTKILIEFWFDRIITTCVFYVMCVCPYIKCELSGVRFMTNSMAYLGVDTLPWYPIPFLPFLLTP